MESFKKKVQEATAFVAECIGTQPNVGILTGTGLGGAVERLEGVVAVPYGDIPHFPVSTVLSHRGRFLCGRLAGRTILAMQGRFHYYEGYSMAEVTLPIRVMQLLGVGTLILSNAAGGLNPGFEAGDIMLISDHINLTGSNPLIGPNVDTWGPRFPDMTRVYDSNLMALAEEAAREEAFRLRKGVYAGLCGPSLETPAEIRFLRTIGADAVGLSTVPEVIVATHGGLAVLGLSVITNIHRPEDPRPSNVEAIIATAEAASPKLGAIMEKVVARLPVDVGALRP